MTQKTKTKGEKEDNSLILPIFILPIPHSIKFILSSKLKLPHYQQQLLLRISYTLRKQLKRLQSGC
mgnify:CR=1 FL=1